MRYFNYRKVAKEAGIAPDKLAKLERIVREEFPDDDMMYELHVLRACMAVRDGGVKLADMLTPSEAGQP